MDAFVVALLIIIAVVAIAAAVFGVYFLHNRRKTGGRPDKTGNVEVDKQQLDTVLKYVEAQKAKEEQKQILKEVKTIERKEKLANFKRDKDQLKEQLKSELAAKEWLPLKSILDKVDKGSTGIYVLYNQTKNKYYVGQAKQINARIKKHFEIEQIAWDCFVNGDTIKIKYLTSNELNKDYNIDHIEKTAIEIFDAKTTGYNKTEGNL